MSSAWTVTVRCPAFIVMVFAAGSTAVTVPLRAALFPVLELLLRELAEIRLGANDQRRCDQRLLIGRAAIVGDHLIAGSDLGERHLGPLLGIGDSRLRAQDLGSIGRGECEIALRGFDGNLVRGRR